MLINVGFRSHHETRSAEAALLRVIFTKAAETGWSWPAGARPSMVSILVAGEPGRSATSIARAVQEYMAMPLMITVQAPQVPRSQTFFAPVMIQMVAQRIQQSYTRLQNHFLRRAINVESHAHWAGPDKLRRGGVGYVLRFPVS